VTQPRLVSDTRQIIPREKTAMSRKEHPAGSFPLSTALVNSACVAVYGSWLPHIGATAARAEAERFARRFHVLVDGPLAPLPDDRTLDAALDAVATVMGAPCCPTFVLWK
jgi:hypothetical protein